MRRNLCSCCCFQLLERSRSRCRGGSLSFDIQNGYLLHESAGGNPHLRQEGRVQLGACSSSLSTRFSRRPNCSFIKRASCSRFSSRSANCSSVPRTSLWFFAISVSMLANLDSSLCSTRTAIASMSLSESVIILE